MISIIYCSCIEEPKYFPFTFFSVFQIECLELNLDSSKYSFLVSKSLVVLSVYTPIYCIYKETHSFTQWFDYNVQVFID